MQITFTVYSKIQQEYFEHVGSPPTTEKFLDNTLFIIMGDHGHRFHEVRKTFIGKIEEKLPMFGMMVPRKLLRKNSDIKSILTENTSSKTFFKFEIVL